MCVPKGLPVLDNGWVLRRRRERGAHLFHPSLMSRLVRLETDILRHDIRWFRSVRRENVADGIEMAEAIFAGGATQWPSAYSFQLSIRRTFLASGLLPGRASIRAFIFSSSVL